MKQETKQSVAFKLAQYPTEIVGSGKTYSDAVNYAGNILVNTNKFVVTASNGNISINVNKFTVTGSNGNTAIAGNLAVNTNKFNVTASSGNTAIAGKLSLAGLIQYADNAAALLGGLTANDLYIVTATKVIAIVV